MDAQLNFQRLFNTGHEHCCTALLACIGNNTTEQQNQNFIRHLSADHDVQ